MNKFFKNKIARKRSGISSLKDLSELITTFQFLALLIVLFINKEVPYMERVVFACGLLLGVKFALFLAPKICKGDHYILFIALMLFSIGSIMIYRLEPSLAYKQVIWLGAGLLSYFSAYFILKLIKGWENWGLLYLILTILLFVATLVFGSVRGGAQNWIVIGGENGFMIQPSEFIKILASFLMAYFYCHYEKISKIEVKGKVIGKYLLMAAVYVFIGLFFLQAELGTAVILYGLLLCMQFIYEEDKKLMFINLGLAIVGGILAYILFDHIKVRISTWIDPWSDIENTGYQITQSLFAIASGGFFGSGIGMGKPNLIPRAYTDFIFSAICEEMGLFAGIGVLMLFLILVYRGFKIAISQTDSFFSKVALGISITFAFQAFIIIGGVTKLIPLTGITIPFVTYGGSSIVSAFMSLGVLAYCSEDRRQEEAIDEE